MSVLQLPRNRQLNPRAGIDVDRDIAVEVLTSLLHEQSTCPRLVSKIRIPELMIDYLEFSLDDKDALEAFNDKYPLYMMGEGEGCGIKYLDSGSPFEDEEYNLCSTPVSGEVTIFARKNRWTTQLQMFFNFFLESEAKKFNNSYIARFNRQGYNLVQNVRNNWRVSGMEEIVRLVSQIEPEIVAKYHPPKRVDNIAYLKI